MVAWSRFRVQRSRRLHRHYLEQGYVDRAAVQAIDLAGMFFMRGEPALGSGWLSRARKLLADQPRGAGRDAHVCRPVRRAGK